MSEIQITYNKILKAAQEFLVSDPELYLNKQDVVPTASLSRDLGLDSLDKLQLIMGIEKQLNIQINDDEIMKRKTGNLGEFCQAIYEQINAPVVKTEQPKTTEDIFKTIEQYLYNTYGIYYAQPKSNWFKDLELNDFQKQNFFKWAEKEFNVEIPYFYFSNLKKLCEVISAEQTKKLVQTQQTNFLQRIKQRLIRQK